MCHQIYEAHLWRATDFSHEGRGTTYFQNVITDSREIWIDVAQAFSYFSYWNVWLLFR